MLTRLLCLLAALLASAAAARSGQPPPLAAYGNLPDIEDMALSPSGGRIAAVGGIGGERRLVVSEGARQIAVIPLEGPKFRDVSWAGDETVILTSSRTELLPFGFPADKIELFEAMLVPLGGGKPEMVFARRRSIGNSIHGHFGSRLVNGRWKAYFGGVELVVAPDRRNHALNHGRLSLYEVDLQGNSSRRIAPSAGESVSSRWLIDGNGRIAATFEITEQGRWRIRNATGATIAAGRDPTHGVGLESLGRDGRTVIYSLEDDAAEAVRWFEVPLSGGPAVEIFAREEIWAIYADERDGRLLGYRTNAAGARPVFFDPQRQALVDEAFGAFPGFDIDLVDWSSDFGRLLLRRSGNGDSGTWLVFDKAGMTARTVGRERPLIPPDQVGPVSTFRYAAADGLELDGILTLPPGRQANNLPVIMLPHGGPGSHDEERFDWWAQAFASRGYAVFQPNFRGSTNRDEAFRRAGNGQWGRNMQTDISDGLAELAKRGIADPKRACIVGASYGGYAALAGVTLQNGLYRCAVAVAPVSDIADMYSTRYRESGISRGVWRSLNENLGDPALFDEVSPRRHARWADAPILLVHGTDDTVVSFGQSRKMADALKRAGKPHELVVLREEDHWLSRAETRKQMLEEAMRFVQKYNPAD